MADKARKSGVRLRPHFKTHQSATVGEWFRSQGINAITVSSVDMAHYFADHGWNDITIAFPANIREIKKLRDIAEKITLNLLVESKETIHFLQEHLESPVNTWIKVDVGYKRTGIPFTEIDKVVELAKIIDETDNCSVSGLLTHAGHSYQAKSIGEIIAIHHDTVARMNHLKDVLETSGFQIQISIGDTPTCSIVDDFSGVDEIRPGNFVFYDLMQLSLGSCSEEDIAIAVACPVVAKHDERKEFVIYGGAVHFSKDYLVQEDGTRNYGIMTNITMNGWGPLFKNNYVSSVSQEHGIVKASENLIGKLKIGSLVAIVPVHSCLTVNLLKNSIKYDEEIVQDWDELITG